VLAAFVSTGLYIPFVVDQGVTYARVGLWTGPVLGLLLIRVIASKRIGRNLDHMPYPKMVRAANDARAYFMAAASHDIKQALQALGLLTDTLLMSDPPAATIEILKSQRDSISRMTEHFEDLMDLARFEGGRFQLNLSRFRLGKFAERVDQEIAPLCAEKGLVWTLDVEDVLIFSDENLLLRLMRNLLINAVNYTASGEVTWSAKSADDVVEFLVSDTGCGIPVDSQALVFDRFVRLNTAEGKSSGSGLGLSIVKKIDHAANLGLHMTSEVGKGTKFVFRLPRIVEQR
jgi:two-component system, sensor histidine kinase